MLNPISFTARYRQTVTIKKCDENNQFQDCKAKFVELDPESSNDISSLSQINRNWGGETFLEDISDEFKDCGEYENPSATKRFYAVTTQNSKFYNLKPQKVLGAAEVLVGQPQQVILKYLQVDPNNNMHCQASQYKKVGSSVINAIKEEFKGKDILLEPVDDDDTKQFYRAHGFQPYGDTNMIYRP